MARRLFTLCSAASLVLCCACPAFLAWTIFTPAGSATFHLYGHLWEIACHGGALLIDNQPQRELEIDRVAAANAESRTRWKHDHDALRFAMEGAPYGPQYTAARLKMDAWEHEHGINWSGGAPAVPSSPLVEYRIYLLVVVLVLLVLPAAWLITCRPNAKSARRRLILGARLVIVAFLVLLLALGGTSFHHPVAVYVFGRDSVYVLLFSRGKVRLGRPPVADPRKLAGAMRLASHFRNDDLIWTVSPSDPPVQISTGRVPRPPPGPMIECEVRPDADYATLGQVSDPETILACLRALHDPARYQTAHIILTRARWSSRAGLPPGVTVGDMRWYGSKVNNLQVALTPKQAAATQPLTFTPHVVPNQQAKLQLQWHQFYDRFTREFPLWPAAVLLVLFPVRWSFVAHRKRRRQKRNQCLACGYDLTANVSGVCPECGAACKAADPAGVSPAAGD